MQLRSGKVIQPINTDLTHVDQTLRKLTALSDMETLVQNLLAVNFDRKLKPILASPMTDKPVTEVVLRILANISFTRDENIERFINRLPRLLPCLFQTLNDYDLTHTSAAVLGNLTANPGLCRELVVYYNLLTRMEGMLERIPDLGLNVNFYFCQILSNVSELLPSLECSEMLCSLVEKMASVTTDTEGFVYLFHCCKNLRHLGSGPLERLSKRLNKMRKLLALIEAEQRILQN